MEQRITDTHIHIVPNVDDGAVDLTMALEMIKMAYEQGVRNIFCTSHNVYNKEELTRYKSQFMMLQMCARLQFPDLKLHMGCELLCAGEYVDDIIYGLDIGVFLPLGESKCVLTELYPDVTYTEAQKVVTTMLAVGWTPILAHVERYPNLFEKCHIEDLIAAGAMIQVNLYSLEEEQDESIKNRARYLVDNKFAGFIGSDAHRTNRRQPRYEQGLAYILKNCGEEYLKTVCSDNPNTFLGI